MGKSEMTLRELQAEAVLRDLLRFHGLHHGQAWDELGVLIDGLNDARGQAKAWKRVAKRLLEDDK